MWENINVRFKGQGRTTIWEERCGWFNLICDWTDSARVKQNAESLCWNDQRLLTRVPRVNLDSGVWPAEDWLTIMNATFVNHSILDCSKAIIRRSRSCYSSHVNPKHSTQCKIEGTCKTRLVANAEGMTFWNNCKTVYRLSFSTRVFTNPVFEKLQLIN